MSDSALMSCAKPRVRDRIFETACELFSKFGIRDVGVDLIATEAGTNKMSFYRSFASKDDLVAEYLEKQGSEFWAWWDGVMAGQPDARRQIEALFDTFVAKQQCEKSRGCTLANAAVELVGDNHPGRQVIVREKCELRRRFRDLAARTGAERADELGDALMLLMEGSNQTRAMFVEQSGPLAIAGRTARMLLSAYAPE
jgi:AcrR family transcriptional regulator